MQPADSNERQESASAEYDWRLDARLSYLEAIKELRKRAVKNWQFVPLNDSERTLARGEGK